MKRKFGIVAATFIVVSTILGPAMFIIPKICIHIAGLSSIYVWIFSSIPFFFVSLIFADLIYRFPREGGVYTYGKVAFGKEYGFLIGWLELIQVFVSSAALAVAASELLKLLLNIPQAITIISILLLFHYIVFRGVKDSEILVYFFTVTLFTALVLSIAFSMKIIYENLHEILLKLEHYNFLKLLYAAYFIFNAYAGWEGITFLAEEVDNPKRTLPYAILIGNFIASIFFMTGPILLSILYYNYGDLFLVKYGFGMLITFLIIIQILGSLFSWILVSPRLIHAMAQEDDIPSILAKKHRKYNTPYIAILIQLLIILFFALTGTFKIILEASNVIYILMYILVALAYIRIIKSYKDGLLPKWVSILSAAISVLVFSTLLLISNLHDFLIALILVSIGLIIFYSKNMRYRKEFVRKIHNILAYLIDILSSVWVNKAILYEIERILGPLNRSKILDYGCSTGILSIYLAKKYRDCIVYSADISQMELRILKKKVRKHKLSNIIILYEKSEGIRKEFKNFFDAIVSIGVLGYIKDKEKLVKDISSSLKPGGKFVFVEYDKILGIFEAPSWVKKEIKDLFRKAGLKVKIKRIKGKLWDIIIIYGEKPKN